MPTTTAHGTDATPGFELTPPRPAAALSGGDRPNLRPDDQPVLSIRASVSKADAGRFIAEALHDVRAFMQEARLPPAGPPFSISRPRGRKVDVEAGWPTAVRPHAGTSRIHPGSLPRSYTGPRNNPGRIASSLEREGGRAPDL
jgi:hypothetical protein